MYTQFASITMALFRLSTKAVEHIDMY